MNLRKKKLLIVYDVSYPFIKGGGQRRFWEIAQRLISKGYDIDWVCFKTWPSELGNIKKDNIHYIGLPGFKGLYQPNGKRRKQEPIEFLLALIKQKINFNSYDYIWTAQWPLTHLLWWMTFPFLISKPKLVIDWWEIWGATWFKYSKTVGWIGYLMEKLLLTRLAKRGKLVLISPGSFRGAQILAGVENTFLIHNGIDSKLYDAKNEAVRSIDLMYLGRLKDHKRVDLLLHAVHYVQQKYALGLITVIVGDGPESVRLKQLADQLHISSLIDFKGDVASNSEIAILMQSSKVFVNPSTKEGGGSITLLEAYAAGMPAVIFKCKDGIDPALLVRLKTGELVLEVSSEALGESIYQMIMNDGNLKLMSSFSKEFSLQFDWNVIAGQYERLFTGDESKKNGFD